jgi:hypothetical protein
MASRIQAKINNLREDSQRKPSKTIKNAKEVSPQLEPRLCRLRPGQGGSLELSLSAPTLSTQHHTFLSDATMLSTRSSKRARSKDSSSSFGAFLRPDPGPDSPESKDRGSKLLRSDASMCGSQTRSSRIISEATFSTVSNSLSNFTCITIPDMYNVNDTDTSNCGLSSVDLTKQKLGHNLARFLNDDLNFAGILSEIIPPTRHLYAISPHRKPGSDLEFEFRTFNRALEHWESLIARLTASASATQSPLNDPLQELAAQKTFQNRVAMLHNCGPRSQIEFPLKRWTVLLALFFEGLLGEAHMPFPFNELVIRLRSANQPLYDFVTVVRD